MLTIAAHINPRTYPSQRANYRQKLSSLNHPATLWWQYLCFEKQHIGQDVFAMKEIFEEAIDSVRFVKGDKWGLEIWLGYVDMLRKCETDPEAIRTHFRKIRDDKIGTPWAKFYITWADFEQSCGDEEEAKTILQLGANSIVEEAELEEVMEALRQCPSPVLSEKLSRQSSASSSSASSGDTALTAANSMPSMASVRSSIVSSTASTVTASNINIAQTPVVPSSKSILKQKLEGISDKPSSTPVSSASSIPSTITKPALRPPFLNQSMVTPLSKPALSSPDSIKSSGTHESDTTHLDHTANTSSISNASFSSISSSSSSSNSSSASSSASKPAPQPGILLTTPVQTASSTKPIAAASTTRKLRRFGLGPPLRARASLNKDDEENAGNDSQIGTDGMDALVKESNNTKDVELDSLELEKSLAEMTIHRSLGVKRPEVVKEKEVTKEIPVVKDPLPIQPPQQVQQPRRPSVEKKPQPQPQVQSQPQPTPIPTPIPIQQAKPVSPPQPVKSAPSVPKQPAPQPKQHQQQQQPVAPTPIPTPSQAPVSAPAPTPSTSVSAASSVSNSKLVQVNRTPYLRLDLIGRGGSSKVYKVMTLDTGKIYALKKVTLKGADKMAIDGYLNEIELLQKLGKNERIIRLVDSQIYQKEWILMVMEYGEIDLAHLLQRNAESHQRLSMNFIRLYWEQMLAAVHAIHEENIIHTDLKPANFLLVEGSLKLIDFGIAKAIPNDTTNIHREHQTGTCNYMSPESLSYVDNTSSDSDSSQMLKLGRASDIWSLGCILYQMVYGKPPFGHLPVMKKLHAIVNPDFVIPFPDRDDVFTKISVESNGASVSAPPPVPTRGELKDVALKDVLIKSLMRNPKKRYTIPELLLHDFLFPERGNGGKSSSVEKSRNEGIKVPMVEMCTQTDTVTETTKDFSLNETDLKELVREVWQARLASDLGIWKKADETVDDVEYVCRALCKQLRSGEIVDLSGL